MRRIELSTGLEEAAAVATEYLMEGGVVVLPMDTSYGLAADATKAETVDKVFHLKGRDHGQPFSIVVRDREHAEQYGRFSPEAARLWDVFIPGSLTLVVPLLDKNNLAEGCTLGKTVGLRQPKNDLTQIIADRFDRPFTATSANRTGQPAAYSLDEFLDQLPDDVAPHLAIDGGQMSIGKCSTVVEVTDGVEILREGEISNQQIEQVLSGNLEQ